MAIRLMNAFKCSRCYANGTLNNYGTYLSAVVDYQSDTPSTYTISYKRPSATSWQSLPRSDVRYYFAETVVSASAILSTDYAYEIKITIVNDNETMVQTAFVSTAFVLLDFNASGKGLAFGKVSERPNEIEFGTELYDRHGTRILNGLAYYEANGAANPDTCIETEFLSSIAALGGFCFVKQFFFTAKTAQSNRTQLAFPYSSSASGLSRSNFRRQYVNGYGWSPWIEEPVITEAGSSGIWTWRAYSDGTAECFGKISISAVAVNAALGGWYRSENLYGSTSYAYPISFSEAPCTEMMFQTTNGQGALIWAFTPNGINSRLYLPQSYIIRPVTASSVTGTINIIAKGKK